MHKDVLSEKDLFEKAATIKKFEYSPLSSELKKQTNIAKNDVEDWTRFINLIKRMILKINRQR